MMKKNWWQEAVVYQIYPRSFQDTNNDGIGDLRGVIQHLDYIKNLGVDVIWLNPIYSSPNDDNGYDIADYRKIMQDFGTMDDFNQLLISAHKKGLKIMMDLVVNHTSDEHHWFMESRKNKDNKYRDYYFWRDPREGKEPNNWKSNFSGSAWQYDKSTDQYYMHLFSKKQPDLNWDNSEVRQEVYGLMKFWLDKGVDGFRMDVINLISKKPGLPDDPNASQGAVEDAMSWVANGPKVHDYLKEMNRKVLSKYDVMTVGETPAASTQDAIKYTGFNRQELEMVFQFEHMGLDWSKNGLGKWSTNKVSLTALKEVMSRWQNDLDGKAWNSLYWNNHDQPRVVSRFGNDSKEYRVRSAKMLGLLLHFMQGTPYIYQGEEIGMTNVKFEDIHEYKDLETLNAYNEIVKENKQISAGDMMRYIHHSSRDNARTPMQWNQNVNAGFSTVDPWIKVNPSYKLINVEKDLKDPNSIYSFYKKMNELRHKYSVIVYGDYELLDPEDEKVFAYKRSLDGQSLLIVANFTSEELTRSYNEYGDMAGKLLLSNYSDDQKTKLRPYEAKVYYYGKGK
ncbi:glycoside hydrolase family 13 protein [Pediococcus inopinatus]|uniref:glycoside hydrolase family 13 protein n=1 Tax=Pediococcus inopinatus TaxID=114090 RepID=UPI0007107DD8|nr:alpha-glucosidase [Pediococcus inopinatus]AVK99193.1 glucohydrolase [Pediococcus inopinatus]